MTGFAWFVLACWAALIALASRTAQRPRRDADHPAVRAEITVVDATDWPDEKLDRLLSAMGVVTQGCVDLTGQEPLTPDLIPVSDAEWKAAFTRLARDMGEAQS